MFQKGPVPTGALLLRRRQRRTIPLCLLRAVFTDVETSLVFGLPHFLTANRIHIAKRVRWRACIGYPTKPGLPSSCIFLMVSRASPAWAIGAWSVASIVCSRAAAAVAGHRSIVGPRRSNTATTDDHGLGCGSASSRRLPPPVACRRSL